MIPVSQTCGESAVPAEILSSGVSVFFPAYNDAPTIGELVRSAHSILAPLNAVFEIVVVNDGSRDETACGLQDLQAELGWLLRIVTHEVNRGYGAALRSGRLTSRVSGTLPYISWASCPQA